MLLTDARRDARTGPDGELIPLTEQDRSRWRADLITEGVALISATLRKGIPGPYQLQAAISALHDEATRVEETDWPQILALYEVLARISDNPMVMLSRAVAIAMVRGPAAGLTELALLDADPRLAGTHRLDAVRGHLAEMTGDRGAAVEHYLAAAGRTASIPEKNYLMMRAARLRSEGGSTR
jgi:predicted RNA polymerase sigma factor